MAANKSKAGDMPRKLNRVPTGPVISKVELPRKLSEQLDAASKDSGMTKSQLIASLCERNSAVIPVDESTSLQLDRLEKKTGIAKVLVVKELVAREIAMYQKNGIRV